MRALMPNVNEQLLLSDACIFGVALLLLGMWIGFRLARMRYESYQADFRLNQGDRERILQLLQDLGTWMRQCARSVSEYQDLLEKFESDVGG